MSLLGATRPYMGNVKAFDLDSEDEDEKANVSADFLDESIASDPVSPISGRSPANTRPNLTGASPSLPSLPLLSRTPSHVAVPFENEDGAKLAPSIASGCSVSDYQGDGFSSDVSSETSNCSPKLTRAGSHLQRIALASSPKGQRSRPTSPRGTWSICGSQTQAAASPSGERSTQSASKPLPTAKHTSPTNRSSTLPVLSVLMPTSNSDSPERQRSPGRRNARASSPPRSPEPADRRSKKANSFAALSPTTSPSAAHNPTSESLERRHAAPRQINPSTSNPSIVSEKRSTTLIPGSSLRTVDSPEVAWAEAVHATEASADAASLSVAVQPRSLGGGSSNAMWRNHPSIPTSDAAQKATPASQPAQFAQINRPPPHSISSPNMSGAPVGSAIRIPPALSTTAMNTVKTSVSASGIPSSTFSSCARTSQQDLRASCLCDASTQTEAPPQPMAGSPANLPTWSGAPALPQTWAGSPTFQQPWAGSPPAYQVPAFPWGQPPPYSGYSAGQMPPWSCYPPLWLWPQPPYCSPMASHYSNAAAHVGGLREFPTATSLAAGGADVLVRDTRKVVSARVIGVLPR